MLYSEQSQSHHPLHPAGNFVEISPVFRVCPGIYETSGADRDAVGLNGVSIDSSGHSHSTLIDQEPVMPSVASTARYTDPRELSPEPPSPRQSAVV